MGNVVSIRGGKVHAMNTWTEGGTKPLCSVSRGKMTYTETSAPVSCKTCLTYQQRAEEAETMKDTTGKVYGRLSGKNESTGGELWESLPLEDAERFESTARALLGDRTEVTGAELDGCNWATLLEDIRKDADYTTKEEIMTEGNDANTAEISEEATLVEQVHANIERAVSLVEAENTDGLEELAKETEQLISSLPSRGKVELPGRDTAVTFAALKKELRNDWRAAAQAQPKPAPKATKAEVIPAKDYTAYEGVSDLVSMGAERVAEGVRLHIKTSTTAKEIASIILDMWRRIPNKDGNPDITGSSDPAKKASSALYQAAGKALGGEDPYEVEQAVKKLMRAVQTQRTDVRAEYLRSLDEDSAEAAEERAHFAKMLEGKGEDVSVSEFLANSYGVGLKGEIEKARERYHANKEVTGGSNGGGEASADDDDTADEALSPDDEVRAIVRRLRADVIKAKPEAFEAATDETKAEVRDELLALQEALKAMITATL
jgi:hypothetical protein